MAMRVEESKCAPVIFILCKETLTIIVGPCIYIYICMYMKRRQGGALLVVQGQPKRKRITKIIEAPDY